MGAEQGAASDALQNIKFGLSRITMDNSNRSNSSVSEGLLVIYRLSEKVIVETTMLEI